jgi:hypothetical protein
MIVGYEGYSPGNSGIADRRRILFWASSRGHSVVSAHDESADVIVVTSSGDLGYWARVKTSKPIVLDVVDGLIGEQSRSKDLFRGLAYWGTRRSSNLLPSSYRHLLLKVARKSMNVVCSSPEQVTEWAKFHIKATDILDIHEEISFVDDSQEFIETNPVEIFWEGLPATLGAMDLLKEFFESNSDKKFKLNILTNLNSFKYMNRYRKVDLDRVLNKQLELSNLEINKVQWTPEILTRYSTHSKLGVIPILGLEGHNHLKAENRLLIMWRLGLPVLTSPLQSYVRVMRAAQIDGICQDPSDWKVKLERLIFSADLRAEFIQKSRNYLELRHRTEDILEKWDFVLGKN